MKSTVLLAGLSLAAISALGGDGSIHRSAKKVAGQYVVVVDSSENVTYVTNRARSYKGSKIHHTYQKSIKGFSVEMNDNDAQDLATDPHVQFVEEDSVVTIAASTWSLDRIDQRFLPLNGSYVYSETGAGVTVYVVDTGIFGGHSDFGGRVSAGFNAIDDGRDASDCHGHGTHVAGVIGGTDYGVAKAVTLVPVRVLDCQGSGTVSGVLAGLDWALADHQQSGRPAVVNMSLTGPTSGALDYEVSLLLSGGLTTVVAAGNSNDNACNYSPARVPGALTVGATNTNDGRAGFSNIGTCVDLFAPGVSILSDWYTSATATAVSSGTSSSAPFVAGVAALCLEKYPTASPGAVSQTIVAEATPGVIGGITDNSPNRLLFSLLGALRDGAGDPTSSDAQLLSDPGFDFGQIFWTSGICSGGSPTGCSPDDDAPIEAMSFASRSGNTHASLGGNAQNSQITSELVSVPGNATSVELSFYLWVVTKDKSKSADDTLKVQIRDGTGAVLGTLGTFSNLDNCPTYIRRFFDASAYRGKTVRISFVATNSHGQPTWFLLDDVGLTAKR